MTLVPWSGSSVARPVSIRGKRRERCWMSLRYFFFFFLPISSLKKKKETQREILWFHSNRRNEEFTRTQTRNGWLCCAVRVIGVARRGGSPETIYRFPGRTSPEKKRRGRAQLVIIISFFFFCSQLLFRVITTCTAALSAEEMENSQTGDPKKGTQTFWCREREWENSNANESGKETRSRHPSLSRALRNLARSPSSPQEWR